MIIDSENPALHKKGFYFAVHPDNRLDVTNKKYSNYVINMFNLTFDQFIHILAEEGQHWFVRLIQDEKGLDFCCNAVKRRHFHSEKRVFTSSNDLTFGLGSSPLSTMPM